MTSLPPLPRDLDLLRAYAYSYPHKSAYRALSPAVPIAEAWRADDTEQLSLYVHIPFCEMRCGFCNLFTQSQPPADMVAAYLSTLARQMNVIRAAVPAARFAQFALGGGTPTFLSPSQLEQLFAQVESAFSVSIPSLPTSIETSPATATPERLKVLKAFGVQRVSVGVQSLVPRGTPAMGRPEQLDDAYKALAAIRELSFPVLNLDLIYGSPGHSAESWLASLREAVKFQPEELYLYPLYVRPGTGLARVDQRPVPQRSDLYRRARGFLLERGYEQLSLRCFRQADLAAPSSYTCQRDGMIGLGCGARSYTRQLHYATRFAVSQAGIQAILSSWIRQTDLDLAFATHGIRLNADEQRRRYLIMSLLQAEGVSLHTYYELFHSTPFNDISELEALRCRGWLDESAPDMLRLSGDGMENSDLAGPLLYSERVRRSLEAFLRR